MKKIARWIAVGLVAVPLFSFANGGSGPASRSSDLPPLGEWSRDCHPAFRLSSMPSAWSFFPDEAPLEITTRLAVDFELLSPDTYRILNDASSGDRIYDLQAYEYIVVEASIRSMRTGAVVTRINATQRTADGKHPLRLVWDGQAKDGTPVPPGMYAVEVRGRVVPAWIGLTEDQGYGYRDLDGWSAVEEACRRPIHVTVTDRPTGRAPVRGISCDAPPATYYSTVDTTTAGTLRSTLHDVIDDHTRFPYTSTGTDCWDILNDADENPSNASQLLSVYKNEAYADGCSSGCDSSLGWNREHTWAKSFGFSEDSGNGRIPYTDCHNLHAADAGYNSSRNNKPHNTCPGCTEKPTDFNNGVGGGAADVNRTSGGSTGCGNTPTSGDVWETWDHRKGDIARSILYMDVRYEGDSGDLGNEQDLIATSNLGQMLVETTSCGDGYQDPAYHGVLSTLLDWHAADPVDTDEERRNDQVWCYQGNRNPFVDHPEWVDCLYNGVCSDTPIFDGIESATDLDPCGDTGVELTWSTPDWNDDCSSGCSRGFNVYRDGTLIDTGDCAGPLLESAVDCTDTTGSNNTMFTYTVEAFNNDTQTSDGDASRTAGDYIDDAAGPVISSGPSAAAGGTSFTAVWTTDEPSDSVLKWGLSSGSYPNSTSDASDVTSHSLTATGLATTTTYYYQVCSTDPCGNGPTCSAEATVTTTQDCDPGTDTGVFINELHYDNDGADTGEFFEIAGPASTDLGDGPWQVELYTAASGTVYDTIDLSGSIDDEGTGYGAVAFYPDTIQNGDPADGLALIDGSGTLVQFLCYEGTFSAASGTAAFGTTCDNIGEESGSTPIGNSLQLSGGPDFVYEAFTWTGPAAESPGDLNDAQSMACGPSPPSFDGIDSATDLDPCDTTGVRIDWTTPTSWNDGCATGCDRGFSIFRDGSLVTGGGCADPLDPAAVSCVDTTGAAGVLYTYTVEAFNDNGQSQDGGAAAGARDATNDGSTPVITSGPTATAGATSFSVIWETDEPSDSVLEWGAAPGTYDSSTSDASDVIYHSLIATGLTPGLTYYFRVSSTDVCGVGPTQSAEGEIDTLLGCEPEVGEHGVFINELHYDNDGTDTGEFVEIAGPAGTDLSAYSLVLYNGSSTVRKPYDTVPLSGTILNEGNGYGAVAITFLSNGIQNGAPDGLALVKGATVEQFLCYEGTFTAQSAANGGGPAAGMTCIDIGVEEGSSTPVGHSLQLTGGPGFVYEDFTWSGPSDDSPGLINSGQTMECDLPPDPLQALTATAFDGSVRLEWENPEDYPTGGTTRICRDPNSYPTDPTTCTVAGTVSERAGSDGSYDFFSDSTALSNDQTYFYAAWVINSSGISSDRKTVSARPFDTSGPAKWAYHSSAASLAPPGLWPGAAGTGAVYAVANDNSLHGMSPGSAGGIWPQDGAFNWRPMPMNGPAHHRPPVVPVTVGAADLVVFLASEDGHAYAVDASTGTTLWPSPELASMITAPVAGIFTAFGGPPYDLLFVGTREAGGSNAIVALHAGSGAVAWAFDDGGNSIGIIPSGAAVDYGETRLYFTSRAYAAGASTVWCLSFTDTSATLEWERSLGDIDSAPVLFDGRVYVGTNSGEIHALDADTGADLWSSPFSTSDGAVKGFVAPGFSALPRSLVFATDDTVWSLTDSGATVGLDWQQSGLAGPSIPLFLETVGIFVGSTDGRLYQLNEGNGGVAASAVLGNGTATIGSPSYDFVNDMAYVGTEAGAVYGIALPLP